MTPQSADATTRHAPDTGAPASRPAAYLRLRVGTWIIGGLVLALLCLTLNDIGLVWDEPPGLGRQEHMDRWFEKLSGSSADRAWALSEQGLRDGWPFAREAPDEHPPVYAIMSYLTAKTTSWLWGPMRGHRLATAILFAVVAAVIFRGAARQWGRGAGLVAVAALVFNPRIYAEGHLATTDLVMAGWWFLAAVALWHTTETGRKPWLFGLLAALSLMSKATGAILFLPCLVWTLLYRRRALRPALWAAVVVPLVMWAVHPGWWRDPLGGVTRWLSGFMAYPQTVPVYYLGRVYDQNPHSDYPYHYLPWHNSAVLLGTTVPVGLLVLGALGLCGAALKRRGSAAVEGCRTVDEATPPRRDALAGLAALNFLTVMLLRAFHILPGHDGLRQMVAAFPFFALLCGFGAYCLYQLAASRIPRRALLATTTVAALAIASAAYQTWRIHPYELAYYNELIGGLPGARRAGMETTYYWDTVSNEVLAWLNTNLPPQATLVILPDTKTFDYLQRWGRLRSDLHITYLPRRGSEIAALMSADDRHFLVLQLREGMFPPKTPAQTPFLWRLADEPARYELTRDGVRLLAVFGRESFGQP